MLRNTTVARGLGRKAFQTVTINHLQRRAAHMAPLKVFDEENVLFTLSTEGIAELLMKAEQEEVMASYERGRQ